MDGFLQSCPYHIYPFLFPLHKVLYLVLFVFVNVWTVSIHDGDYRVPATLKPFVNGSAHHTDHHLFYNYNYGQFFTLWDRIGGSFRNPSSFEGQGPIKTVEEYCRQNGVLKNGHHHKNGAAKKIEWYWLGKTPSYYSFFVILSFTDFPKVIGQLQDVRTTL